MKHLSGQFLMQRVELLAKSSDVAGNLTRLYLSQAHKEAVQVVQRWMREAGMSTRIDGAATLHGLYKSDAENAPRLVFGSHIDTVCDAGKFDGNLGVICAISMVWELHRQKLKLPFDLEVVAFGDEEGVRFPTTLCGSRALAGRFDPLCLDDVDASGVTRRKALLDFGVNPQAISSETLDPKRTLGYVELHIEQGPVLEAGGCPLGIVTAINGASRGHVVVRGVAGHAGTLPMAMRKDALSAAAEIVLEIEKIARAAPDLVATVGTFEVQHGAGNVVPSLVKFSVDIRAPQDKLRHDAIKHIEHALDAISKGRGTSAILDIQYDARATACDAGLMTDLAAAVAKNGLTVTKLPSGAGHDAMAFRDRIPVAMLFVRSKDGISHNPAEFSSEADIELGAKVLYDFVISLKDKR